MSAVNIVVFVTAILVTVIAVVALFVVAEAAFSIRSCPSTKLTYL